VGTRRFSSSNQFSTTLICVGADAVALGASARLAHPRPDSGDEIDQVAKTVLQHVPDGSCFQSVPKFWYQARVKVISADRRFD
jgi:hypothetical protein